MRTTVDPARTRRALALQVEELEDGAYRVTGGSEPHVVRGRTCDCPDAIYFAGPCKHRTAVYLHRQLDRRVRVARLLPPVGDRAPRAHAPA